MLFFYAVFWAYIAKLIVAVSKWRCHSLTVVSSLRQAPKPGYTLAPRSHTFSSVGGTSSQAGLAVRITEFKSLFLTFSLTSKLLAHECDCLDSWLEIMKRRKLYIATSSQGEYPFGNMGEKTHSTEFSSARSDSKCKMFALQLSQQSHDNEIRPFAVSTGSITEADRRALGGGVPDIRSSTTYTGGFRYPSASPHLRRSLPNMTPAVPTEPLKVYPYHLLMTTNYRLPADVDRNNLEVRTAFHCIQRQTI